MKYNLPKPYLSWSQMSLWKYSQKQYIDRYVHKKPPFVSPEMQFGSKVGKMIEKGEQHAILNRVPRGDTMELEIKTEINGVPTLSFLDSYGDKNIYEYKTGYSTWDWNKVNNHGQLVFYYSVALKTVGANPEVSLSWIETERKYRPLMIDGIEMGETYDLELTGRIETFVRKIELSEVHALDEEVARIAGEITSMMNSLD